MTDPVTMSHDGAWDVRRAAVGRLAELLGEEVRAFGRLVEMLDDEDTGVGHEAALALIARGGPAGLAEVLRMSEEAPETNVREWMWAAVRSSWVDGGFVLDVTLVDLRDHHPDAVVRSVAREALADVCMIPQDDV